ncbi:MAG: hypothetical protein MHPDNHAH_02205 [Anaerolineales bacterium]|nr:hypothetical protein [Anaerolineales bacterium]
MKSTTESGFRIVFLVTTLISTLASCNAIDSLSTNTPTSNWQPLPTYLYDAPTSNTSSYTHYTPSKTFEFHLEFDYPSHWLLTEHINEIGWASIFLADPRILTLPTPYPDDHHPIPHDFGNIAIWSQPSNPGQTPDTELQSHKQSYTQIPWRLTILSDYKTKIDGYDAGVLEYLSDDPEDSPSLMFIRRIFIVVNDQMYEIYYSVAEKERGGEFEQGFEHFFNSLKIVP